MLERTLFLGHWLCEVGWPAPFLAAFISPVSPPGPHSLLGGQWAGIQTLVRVGSRTVVFGTVGKHSNRYATHPYETYYVNNINWSAAASGIQKMRYDWVVSHAKWQKAVELTIPSGLFMLYIKCYSWCGTQILFWPCLPWCLTVNSEFDYILKIPSLPDLTLLMLHSASLLLTTCNMFIRQTFSV